MPYAEFLAVPLFDAFVHLDLLELPYYDWPERIERLYFLTVYLEHFLLAEDLLPLHKFDHSLIVAALDQLLAQLLEEGSRPELLMEFFVLL